MSSFQETRSCESSLVAARFGFRIMNDADRIHREESLSTSMELAANLEKIQGRIAAACQRAGRDPASVLLLAVTKTHPPEVVTEAARLGLTFFGESKVQEAKAKIPHCPGRLHWHMIGHLQTNKCRDALQLFEMVQSVDSLAVAEELNKRAEQAGKTMPILMETNLAGESTKFGYGPEALLNDLKTINALPRLEI